MPSARPNPFTIRLPDQNADVLKDAIRSVAKAQGKTANQFVVDAIAFALSQHHQKDGQSVL